MLRVGENAEKNNRKGYVAGLDGLRALAVLAVLCYHFGFPWARGGFLGVDIFFVISGFLITSILLPQEGKEGKTTLNTSLSSFWMGRIRRLVPAAYAMIFGSLCWAGLVRENFLHNLWGEAVSSIFYSSNWWFIFHEVSYFDSFGSPSPIKNLWSLAIEQQFYLVWPLLLLAAVKLCPKRKPLFLLVLAGALASAVLMAVLYQPGGDPSRIYYGTDTRCFELLIGSLLAIVLPLNRISTIGVSFGKNMVLNAVGTVTLAVFAASVFLIDEFDAFIYQGGMFLFCINSALLIVAVCYRGSFWGKIFSCPPLRWVGTRSYGIYLWHYPVMIFTTPAYELGHPVYWRVAAQVIFTFVLAEISYRMLETPIRKLGFRGAFGTLAERTAEMLQSFRKKALVTGVLCFLIFVFALGMTGSSATEGEMGQRYDIGQTTDQEAQMTASVEQTEKTEIPLPKPEPDQIPEQTEIAGETGQDEALGPQEPEESEAEVAVLPIPSDHEVGIGSEGPEPEREHEIQPPPQPNPETRAKNPYQAILAVGDSLTINLSDSLQKKYENITVDGKVGRQMSQAIELAVKYQTFNDPQKAVIIQLGTNGYFTEKQLDTLLDAFADAPIYLINVRVPRNWEYKVNEALAKKAAERNNVTLIDWYAQAADHPEYFSSDGVHLRTEGVEVLTGLIDQALVSNENAGIAFSQ